MGGYRTFDTISPRTQYLITERLGLTLGCYDPVSCLGKVIVDADGNRIGFVTFVEAMLSEIQEAGVRFFFGHAMSSMARNGENYNVYLAGLPFPVAAQRVILTMPQYPLQMVRSPLPPCRPSPPSIAGATSGEDPVRPFLGLFTFLSPAPSPC